jgi:methyl coenzyme M reductase subunit C
MFAQPLLSSAPQPSLDTVYFSDWLETYVLNPKQRAGAIALFAQVSDRVPDLKYLDATPQTPPFHAEGHTVGEHVRRCLAMVMAIEQGASLASIEELVREKSLVLEFHALGETIKAQAAFLCAYALCHDLGKTKTVVFEAMAGSQGEAEGFGAGLGKLATEADKVRYDKLRRAHEVSIPQTSFYEAYKIVAHYPGHASAGASVEFEKTREAVLETLRVSPAHAKLLTSLIRVHMDVIKGFSQGPDPKKYASLVAIAEQAGLHVPVFLEILPAALFIDAIAGSLILTENTRTQTDFSLLIHFFQSEREAMPARHAERQLALQRGRKAAVKQILQTAGIDSDTVFAMLQTPYGPVRGQTMRQIYDLIRDPEVHVDFSSQTLELRRRARLAHTALQAQHLSIDFL